MLKQNFNRDWNFKKLTVEFGLGELLIPEEKKVTLPHDAMILEKRDPKNLTGTSGGFYPGGDYEYTKKFYIPETDRDQTIILEFEGIYNRGYVYVNNALAGHTEYGYQELTVDITPYLYFGEENMITVKVINSDVPNSRWYTGAGIFRPVSLYQGGKIRIECNGLKISASEISKESAAVRVDTQVRYDLKNRKTIDVLTEIFDENGEKAASQSLPVTLFAEDDTLQTQRIYIQNPKLWSVDTPHLYRCKTTLCDGGEVLDVAESTFGIRKLELNPMEGLKLNGEKILLRGGCIHHDNGPVGAATFDRAEERRIELLKEAGFNSVRISHNAASRSLLNACDKVGMLVMEESFDTWTHAKKQFDSALVFTNIWEKCVEGIVDKDFNHPSVFMYSIGNEITDLGTPDGAKWNRMMINKFHKLDPSRYVTNAVNSLVAVLDRIPEVMADFGIAVDIKQGEGSDDAINDAMTALLGKMNDICRHPLTEEKLKEAYGAMDLIGLNYARGAYGQMAEYPNRVFYGSETLPPDIDLNWQKVKELPACIGDYTWTAWDYIGETGVGVTTYDDLTAFAKGYPVYLAYCGDFDITGYRRPISYYREIVFGFRKDPYIAVQLPEHYGQKAGCTPWATPESVSSWSWKGYEGRNCLVEVYSDAPETELFVNGKSAGKLLTGESNRFKAICDVTYEPGEIKAVSYYVDGTTREFAMKTASDNLNLKLTVDRDSIEQDDLAYVAVEVVDENGILQTMFDRRIKVTVEGCGVLQGYGSADPRSEENFFDTERRTCYGRAIAVVRAGESSGMVKLHAETEGIAPAEVEILVK